MGEPVPTSAPNRDVFIDGRGDGRVLRVSWHQSEGMVVISLWEWDHCRATFRLAPADVPDLIDLLAAGLPPDGDQVPMHPTARGGHQGSPDGYGYTDDGRPGDGFPGHFPDRVPDRLPEHFADHGMPGPEFAGGPPPGAAFHEAEFHAAELRAAEFGAGEFGPAETGRGRPVGPPHGFESPSHGFESGPPPQSQFHDGPPSQFRDEPPFAEGQRFPDEQRFRDERHDHEPPFASNPPPFREERRNPHDRDPRDRNGFPEQGVPGAAPTEFWPAASEHDGPDGHPDFPPHQPVQQQARIPAVRHPEFSPVSADPAPRQPDFGPPQQETRNPGFAAGHPDVPGQPDYPTAGTDFGSTAQPEYAATAAAGATQPGFGPAGDSPRSRGHGHDHGAPHGDDRPVRPSEFLPAEHGEPPPRRREFGPVDHRELPPGRPSEMAAGHQDRPFGPDDAEPSYPPGAPRDYDLPHRDRDPRGEFAVREPAHHEQLGHEQPGHEPPFGSMFEPRVGAPTGYDREPDAADYPPTNFPPAEPFDHARREPHPAPRTAAEPADWDGGGSWGESRAVPPPTPERGSPVMAEEMESTQFHPGPSFDPDFDSAPDYPPPARSERPERTGDGPGGPGGYVSDRVSDRAPEHLVDHASDRGANHVSDRHHPGRGPDHREPVRHRPEADFTPHADFPPSDGLPPREGFLPGESFPPRGGFGDHEDFPVREEFPPQPEFAPGRGRPARYEDEFVPLDDDYTRRP